MHSTPLGKGYKIISESLDIKMGTVRSIVRNNLSCIVPTRHCLEKAVPQKSVSEQDRDLHQEPYKTGLYGRLAGKNPLIKRHGFVVR